MLLLIIMNHTESLILLLLFQVMDLHWGSFSISENLPQMARPLEVGRLHLEIVLSRFGLISFL